VIIDRAQNHHAAFGLGIHRCISSNLARMEIRVALAEWLARIPEFRLDGFTGDLAERHRAWNARAAAATRLRDCSASLRSDLIRKALAHATATDATLVFAKLDRLTRNVDLLRSLVASDVDLVFCDLPHVPPRAMGRFLLTQMASWPSFCAINRWRQEQSKPRPASAHHRT
jgi:hypothetical protein